MRLNKYTCIKESETVNIKQLYLSEPMYDRFIEIKNELGYNGILGYDRTMNLLLTTYRNMQKLKEIFEP